MNNLIVLVIFLDGHYGMINTYVCNGKVMVLFVDTRTHSKDTTHTEPWTHFGNGHLQAGMLSLR